MSYTQKFWTNQLIAHGWASWMTGYAIAFLSLITWYIAPFETHTFWDNPLLDFYSTGFLNALLLLVLTPVYVPVFGLIFKITTPPLWLFILLGIILEYAITMTLGGVESLANGEANLPLQKSVIALVTGGIYGFLVHRTMDAKLNPTSQKSIPLWHKGPMVSIATSFFKGVMPAVGTAIVVFFIYSPVDTIELLSSLSVSLIFLGFLSLSALIAVGFLVLLLPYYLMLCLFEHVISITHRGRTLATYGVFVVLGAIHLTLMLNIIDPSWDIWVDATDVMLESQEYIMLTWTWTIITNIIIAYLYNRQWAETKSS